MKFFLSLIISLLLPVSSFCFENQTGQPSSEPITQSTANTISLNIKGMDILDILKTFSTYSGMNIVVGKNVSGKVSLFLKDVGIWDAFEILLLASDLAYEKKAGIITVMTQRDYELQYGQRSDEKKKGSVIQLKYAKAADLAQALNQMKSNIGRIVADPGSNTLALMDIPERIAEMEAFIKETDLPLETQIFELDFAQAEKLQPKIQEILTKNVGTIRIDERTNKIAVTDYPAKLEEIATIIGAFDEKTMQVLIDAQIVEITPSRTFKMGVDWDFWFKKNVRLVGSLPTAGAVNKLSIGAATTNAALNEPEDFKGVIDLLRTIGDLKILSSPRIMAINNQEARILVGTKQPYAQQTTVTGDGGVVTTSETINYVDVGIKLFVTPTINRQGFISMKIKPEVSSAGTPLVTSKGEQIPVVSTSEAETSVMVRDGVSIIIGGLTKQQSDHSVSQIPFLGDIPILGHLFTRTAKEEQKTELVILLTPHIMSGDSAFTDFAQAMPENGTRLNLEDNTIVKERFVSVPPVVVKDLTAAEYYQLVVNLVKSKIRSPNPLPEQGTIEVTFGLFSNGKLAGKPVITSSSCIEMIPSVLNAIKAAEPFPPFPVSMRKNRETFSAQIVFE